MEEDIDRLLDDRDIQNIGKAITGDWKFLGKVLGLRDHVSIKEIEKDHERNLVRVVYVLHTWKRLNSQTATIRSLFKVIGKHGVTVDHLALTNHFGKEASKLTEHTPIRSSVQPTITDHQQLNDPIYSVGNSQNGAAGQESQNNRPEQIRPTSDDIRPTSDDKKLLEELFNSRYDGRLIEMKEEHVTAIRKYKVSSANGGFGTVHFTKQLPGLGIKVAMKDITMSDDRSGIKQRSVTCEKLVSRIMHFGICPLLACWENGEKTLSTLLFPYMEGGNLANAIKTDNEAITNDKVDEVKMDYKTRLRILYQVAAALDYLHSDIRKYTSAIVAHGDIKSDNIVLDGKMNARLTDFGLSERKVTPESTTDQDPFTQPDNVQLPETKSHKLDLKQFGIVVREMLTGKTAKDVGDAVKDFIEYARCRHIWDTPETSRPSFEILLELSEDCMKCLNCSPVTEIAKTMTKLPICPQWSHDDSNKCQLCLVNNGEKHMRTLTGHLKDECRDSFKVCVTCMRNFYLNPIKCHTCKGDIRPPVGVGWGALLIAGNDEKNEDLAASFTEEINKLGRIFTSKCPPVTMIDEANVKIVTPTEAGKPCSGMQENLETAFDELSKSPVDKLIFVFCGHYDRGMGFRLGTDTRHLLAGSLTQKLDNMAKLNKIFIFLDCCNPPTIQLQKYSMQLKACSEKHAITDNVFTQFIQQALTRKSLGGRCLNSKQDGDGSCDECKMLPDDFITVFDLHCYVDRHYKTHEKIKRSDAEISAASGSKDDAIIAFSYNFQIEVFITVNVPGNEKNVKMGVKPSEYNDMNQLKAKILNDHLNKKQSYWQGLDSARHFDIVSIQYQDGPRPSDVTEIDTLDRLMAAWNAKVGSLKASLRKCDLEKGAVALRTEDFYPEGPLVHEDEIRVKDETIGVVELLETDTARVKITYLLHKLLLQQTDILKSYHAHKDKGQLYMTFARKQVADSCVKTESKRQNLDQSGDMFNHSDCPNDNDRFETNLKGQLGGTQADLEEIQSEAAKRISHKELVRNFVSFHLQKKEPV